MPGHISVVLPTFNGDRHLTEVLEAIAAQTLPPTELIAVDDASTDDTLGILRQFAARSPFPVRIVARGHNSGGPAVPIAEGFAACRTDLCSICEQDDRMYPRKLETVQDCFRNWPEAGLALSRYDVTRTDSSLVRSAVSDDTYSNFGELQFERRTSNALLLASQSAYVSALRRNYAVSFSNMSFRVAEWQRVQPLDPSMRRAGDHGVLLRMASRSRIALIDVALWSFRRHPGSAVQATSWEQWSVDYRKIWKREHEAEKQGPHHVATTAKYRNVLRDCCYAYRKEGNLAKSYECWREGLFRTGVSARALEDGLKLLVTALLQSPRRFQSHASDDRFL